MSDWESKPISEIAEHRLGKMLDKRKNKGTPHEYLRNVNVRWFSFDLDDLKEMKFANDEHEKHTVLKGDLVICEGGYPGRAAIWNQDEPMHFQKALHRVRFHEPERNVWFLYYLYYLDSTGQLDSHFTGAGIQHFTGQTLAKLQLPLPPLPEQKQIVAILDKAFSAIAKAKAAAEKNLANARELFESYLDRVFTDQSETWEQKPMKNACEFQNGYAFKSKWYSKSGIRLLRNANMSHGFVDWTNDVEHIPMEQAGEFERFRLNEGDVVLSLDRPIISTGLKAAILRPADIPSLLLQRVLRITSEEIEQEYLYHWLFSSHFRDEINPGRSLGVPHISAEEVGSIRIAYPDRDEQKRIVRSIQMILELSSRLETIYTQKLANLDELKQSLLQKAFTGQLTAGALEEAGV